jgi:hypothetical protein
MVTEFTHIIDICGADIQSTVNELHNISFNLPYQCSLRLIVENGCNLYMCNF